MDSVSSRVSPLKHDPPPWNNRHEDFKRAAFSSLDKDLHQWKHGHAKQELSCVDGSVNFSKLDKARSFATKEATHRYGPHPENFSTERSGNSNNRRLGSEGEKEVLERGKLQKLLSQKMHGGDPQPDEKKDPIMPSRSEEGVRSVKNSYGRNSGAVAPCRSSSLGTERPHLKQTIPGDQTESLRSSQGLERTSSKHTILYNNKTSVVPCHSDTERSGLKRTSGCANTSVNPGRKPTEKDSFADKDRKRIIKLKAKISTDNGSKDGIRSCVKEENFAVCTSKGMKNEEKHSVSSSKSFNGSSDELSWKNSSPVEYQKSSPPSSEQTSDREVLETPVAFLHIARRARSERRRDDSSRSHSSKGVSLDGFGAELEEALLKKQEAEVDSGAQHATDAGAVTSPRSTDPSAEIVFHQQESHMQRLMGLEQTQRLEQTQSVKGLEHTIEREEGELEPEDEGVEKHSLEADGTVKVDAGNVMEVKSNLDKRGKMANLEVCEMHNEVSKHEIVVSASKGKSSDVGVSIANTISASRNRQDQGQELNRNCGTVRGSLHGCEGDLALSDLQHEAGTLFTAMEENLATPVCASTDMNLQPSNAVLNAKGFASSQETSLPLSTQASEAIAKVSNDKGLHTHELSKICGNSGGKFLNGESPVQMEGGVMNDSAGHVQDGDELFAHDHKQKKLKVESLQLSLALPGYTTSPAKSTIAGHVDSERSVTHLSRRKQHLSQFRTEAVSDGLTTSLSLSSFVHNPSCSLNFTTIEDQDLSCGGRRQNIQGRVTPGGSLKEPSDVNRSVSSLSRDTQKRKAEAPLCPQIFQTSTMFSSHTEGNKNMGSTQAAPTLAVETAARALESKGSMQQERIQKLFNQAQAQPQPHPQPRVMAKTLCEPSSLAKNVSGERSKETLGEMKLSSGKVGPLEICSEPVAAMAQKLQELPDSFLEGLKGSVRELLGSFVKREEFLALQQILRSRMDLSEETLLRAHPTQLEILVALKTGMQSFVQQGAKALTYKALIEIFFQTKCRNVDCQQALPVDGCECKVCSQRKGFCHDCMCMVCSKFDSDSNTSRWVGCDHCMHWCHTDCGLRMSHIKSTSVSQRTSEIQFQCLSCDHYMELYGFVKGVFENFAASWSAETLAKELDCVRRIFHASEDGRGKQLRWKAEEMLQKLENSVTASDVCCCMLQFFSGSGVVELERADHVSPRKVHSEQPNEVLKHNAEDGKGDFAIMGSIVARKLSNLVEVYANKELKGSMMRAVEMQKDGAREGVKLDLHNMIGEKLTDVLMYQARADAAREDATNLRHIILSKARRLEEDDSFKCARLRLEEVEGRRKRLFEELQALQKSQHDFETMKIQIQSDMKHLTVMSNLQLS